MSDWKQWALFLLFYLIGSFPTGVVLSRKRFGIDVREMGSGNIGATNITRNFGWKAGLITFLVDFMKGYVGLRLVEVYSANPWIVTGAGIAVVAGHCYSVFLRFRGGKGVATSMGCLFATVPIAGVLMAVIYLALLAVTRVSAIGSLVGISVAGIYAALAPVGPAKHILVFGLVFIVFLRHQTNVRRWVSGVVAP